MSNKISKKESDKLFKNAYWKVLINCPEDDSYYKDSYIKITQVMSVFFIHEKRLEATFFRKMVQYMHELSLKSYNREFKDLKDVFMDEVLYLTFRKFLTVEQLSLFYNSILDVKPTMWCQKCRRYSINNDC